METVTGYKTQSAAAIALLHAWRDAQPLKPVPQSLHVRRSGEVTLGYTVIGRVFREGRTWTRTAIAETANLVEIERSNPSPWNVNMDTREEGI